MVCVSVLFGRTVPAQLTGFSDDQSETGRSKALGGNLQVVLVIGPLISHLGRPVMAPWREIDKFIHRLVAVVEIQFGYPVPVALKPSGKLLKVAPLEQHRAPIVDRLIIVQEVELRRMHREPAGAQRIQHLYAR